MPVRNAAESFGIIAIGNCNGSLGHTTSPRKARYQACGLGFVMWVFVIVVPRRLRDRPGEHV